MNIQHTIVSLDFLLLKAFAPAIGKLSMQIILQIFHFFVSQRVFQHDSCTAHQFSVPNFYRRNRADYLFFNSGIALFIKVRHEVSGILFYSRADAFLIADHIRTIKQRGIIGYSIVPAILVYFIFVEISCQWRVKFECNFFIRYCKTSF